MINLHRELNLEELTQKYMELKETSNAFILDFRCITSGGRKILGKVFLEVFDNGTLFGIILDTTSCKYVV